MKATWRRWVLFFFLGIAVFPLPAQQDEADRRLLADIRAKAEKADVQAQYLLGRAFAAGAPRLGVAKDSVEAVRWLRKAAEQGNLMAQTTLWVMYYEGDGVSQDVAEAARWLRKAAEQGHSHSQAMLGLMYDVGMGLPIDDKEAIRWYGKAAKQGQAQAQVGLGRMLFAGRGGTTNKAQAVEWLRKAAEQGDAEGQYRLGFALGEGSGVPQDEKEGVRWFRQAAEQGYADAQVALGLSYALGKGVVQDFVTGYRWLSIAAASGLTNAASARDGLLGMMTQAQIAEGQRLARDFKPRRPLESGSAVSEKAIRDSRPVGSGTGFFISEDGFLVTNEHVVKDAAQVWSVTEAGLISARVVRACLKIP